LVRNEIIRGAAKFGKNGQPGKYKNKKRGK
jgi:hypothetical protein